METSDGGLFFSIASFEESDLGSAYSLTFPLYRPLLEKLVAGNNSKERAVAFVARSSGSLIGLVLSRYTVMECDFPDGQSVQNLDLLSVMTSPLWRHCGVASALMSAMAEKGRSLGCVICKTGYTTKIGSLVALEHLLASAGWTPPMPQLHIALFRVSDMAKASWQWSLPSLPEGYELFVFSELRDEERAGIMAGIAAGYIPEELSPFADEKYQVPELSVGLRKGGDVVAWMTLTRAPHVADALCYRSLFVHPKMRTGNGFGPLVAREAFYLHAASKITEERPKGLFGTSFSATKQLNFAKKRLSPYCYDIYASKTATLLLQQEQHSAT